jgi:hypothetical protein
MRYAEIRYIWWCNKKHGLSKREMVSQREKQCYGIGQMGRVRGTSGRTTDPLYDLEVCQVTE